MDAIPSIPEHSATGDVAALYRDIKTTLGTPSVNLVWRHLASIEGALPWVWRYLRPLYQGALLEREALHLVELAETPRLRKFSRETLKSAGVEEAELVLIRAVFANYDESNARNLLALNAVLSILPRDRNERECKASAVDSHLDNKLKLRPQPNGTHTELPPLIAPVEMDPMTRAAALGLEGLGLEDTVDRIIAGVPRHLANWPSFLELCVETLKPHSDSIGQSIKKVQRLASQRGAALSATLKPPEISKPEPAVKAALERFTSAKLIANYIPKVRALRLALPDVDEEGD